MPLVTYLSETSRLLQNPAAPTTLYNNTDLTTYVNIARGQIAGEARCIRVIGSLATVIGQRAYDFSAVDVGVPANTGVQGVIHVRRINIVVGQGQQTLGARAWEWFNLFNLNNATPESGRPREWAQYGQGASAQSVPEGFIASGSLYIDPIPDQVYTLLCDCACYPIQLANDTQPEALPYLWTDAVPFYAAWYALLSSQAGAREADADRMYARYQEFMQRARHAANPDAINYIYQQSPDPVQANKLGLPRPKGAA